MKKALQILNTGIDALQKSILFSDDENYKEMVVAEIAEYQEAIAELEEYEDKIEKAIKEADKINDCENNCIHRNSDKTMDLGCYECSRYYSDKFKAKG